MAKKKVEESTINFKIPKKLEQHLIYLETVSKRSKNFIIREALIQYLEDAEDISKVEKWVKESKKGKTYTSEEVREFLERKNLKELDV